MNKKHMTQTHISIEHARILLVEDELILAEDIRSNLMVLGYSVPEPVVSGEEA